MVNLTQMKKLCDSLDESLIPYQIRQFCDGAQVCYPNAENCVCSIICHSGVRPTYGHTLGFLEISGLTKNENDCEGWLSAEEVFSRISHHYDREKENMKARIQKSLDNPPSSKNKLQILIEEELKKQFLERLRSHKDNMDILCLYVLYEKYGWGPKRLRKFYENFIDVYKSLDEYYELPDDDCWIAETKLKGIGVDVRKWNEETYGKNR